MRTINPVARTLVHHALVLATLGAVILLPSQARSQARNSLGGWIGKRAGICAQARPNPSEEPRRGRAAPAIRPQVLIGDGDWRRIPGALPGTTGNFNGG